MRFIGDVHGKFDQYSQLIAGQQASIQVGDFGVGFGKASPNAAMSKGSHWFLRGNHDNPARCQEHPQWIPDGTMHAGVFCIGGAMSIDRDRRIEGHNWWPEEELSLQALNRIIDDYEAIKPDYVATHDIPEAIARAIFPWMTPMPSRTRQALDVMYVIHRPRLWVFGHWHLHAHTIIQDCEFLCLPELAVVDIDLT